MGTEGIEATLRSHGARTGAHLAGVFDQVQTAIDEEPDRLMHQAAMTGRIDPTDARYRRFLTPDQIETFNQNMRDNADLVRAHAEDYRQQVAGNRQAGNDSHLKSYLSSIGLRDPTQTEAFAAMMDPAAGKSFQAHQQAIWMGGARDAVAQFGARHGWKPEEVAAYQQAGDTMYGVPAAPRPQMPMQGAPASQGAPPAPMVPNSPMQPPSAPAAPAAPMGASPGAPTAAVMQGRPPVPGNAWMQNASGMRAAPGGRPQVAGPPVTLQPGQPGALSPDARMKLLQALAGP